MVARLSFLWHTGDVASSGIAAIEQADWLTLCPDHDGKPGQGATCCSDLTCFPLETEHTTMLLENRDTARCSQNPDCKGAPGGGASLSCLADCWLLPSTLLLALTCSLDGGQADWSVVCP